MIAIVLAHLVGDALLLFAGYYWLGLGDSTGGLVAASAVLLLVLVAATMWLHGTAMVFFRRRETVSAAALTAARHLLPLMALAIFAGGLYWFFSYLDGRFSHQAFVIGSYATMKTRKPVAPSSVLTGWHIAIGVFRWLIVPALLFPLATGTAERGWPGISLASLNRARSWVYWIAVAVLLAAAIYVPFRLVDWVPPLATFAAQFASFTGRFALAYLLFVCGLLTLEYIGAKSRTQSA